MHSTQSLEAVTVIHFSLAELNASMSSRCAATPFTPRHLRHITFLTPYYPSVSRRSHFSHRVSSRVPYCPSICSTVSRYSSPPSSSASWCRHTASQSCRRASESSTASPVRSCRFVCRGHAGSARGHVGSTRGQVRSARGQAGSTRGQAGSTRGQVDSARGHLGSARGQVGPTRGHVSLMRGYMKG